MAIFHAEGVNELLGRCCAARDGGADFPTVSNQIVRTHPLVLGLPIQVIVESQPQLKIQLINGQFLCVSRDTYYLA